MSKSSGRTQTQTATSQQNQAPWGPAQSYLTDIMARGSQYANKSPNQLVSPFSPQSQQAMALTEQRALRGSPVMSEANRFTQSNLRGDYLNPDSNPYLPYYMKRGMQGIMPGINATFGAGGRTGSGAHAMALGQGAGDLAAQLYGGAYEADRGRQMQSMLFAPQLAANDYQDINALLGVGGNVESRAQQLMDSPYNQLSRYAGLVGNGFGSTGSGTSSTSIPMTSNPLAGALGGAMAGGQLGSTLGGVGSAFGPWGAAAGGILGLLGGL